MAGGPGADGLVEALGQQADTSDDADPDYHFPADGAADLSATDVRVVRLKVLGNVGAIESGGGGGGGGGGRGRGVSRGGRGAAAAGRGAITGGGGGAGGGGGGAGAGAGAGAGRHGGALGDDADGAGGGAARPLRSRSPTRKQRTMFAQNLYNIAPGHLARVVQVLAVACGTALIADEDDPESVTVNVNVIDAETFWRLDAHVKSVLPGGERYTVPQPPDAEGGEEGGGGGAPAASGGKRGRGGKKKSDDGEDNGGGGGGGGGGGKRKK